jgi:hypothetical protein
MYFKKHEQDEFSVALDALYVCVISFIVTAAHMGVTLVHMGG